MRADLHVEPLGRNCRVALDGVDISKGTRGFTLSANVHELTTLTIDLAVRERIDIAGEVHVELTPESEEALLQLGWTPPNTAPVDQEGADHPPSPGG